MARMPPSEYPPCAPPGPAFHQCACRALVSEHVWIQGTKETPAHWRGVPERLTAALGLPHGCARSEEKNERLLDTFPGRFFPNGELDNGGCREAMLLAE